MGYLEECALVVVTLQESPLLFVDAVARAHLRELLVLGRALRVAQSAATEQLRFNRLLSTRLLTFFLHTAQLRDTRGAGLYIYVYVYMYIYTHTYKYTSSSALTVSSARASSRSFFTRRNWAVQGGRFTYIQTYVYRHTPTLYIHIRAVPL